MQEESNRRYVTAQGGELVATYQEVDSRANPSRAGFDRLLADVRADMFDAVVAYKVGRVGRLAFISLQFAEELQRAGLEVHGAKTGAYNLKRLTDRFRYQMVAKK
ncbi:recombinase family protein [Meiothermus sp. CFH 77666]|uniref:recombinase family protein n=1 Tax=Meiothermus sp. CFH 77666 TaxID=2817942 RepID=UPI001AA01B3A|nr:recombinase family protein [Meiothermus sp. CFH 77666]